MLAAQDRVEVQHELLARLDQARAETDRLFDHVKQEFLYERPIPERHRIVFYIGHLEAFDWNLLRDRVVGRTSFHSEFDNLFAFGIDPVDGGLPIDQPSDWPSLAQVRNYVDQVRQALGSKSSSTFRPNHDSPPSVVTMKLPLVAPKASSALSGDTATPPPSPSTAKCQSLPVNSPVRSMVPVS